MLDRAADDLAARTIFVDRGRTIRTEPTNGSRKSRSRICRTKVIRIYEPRKPFVRLVLIALRYRLRSRSRSIVSDARILASSRGGQFENELLNSESFALSNFYNFPIFFLPWISWFWKVVSYTRHERGIFTHLRRIWKYLPNKTTCPNFRIFNSIQHSSHYSIVPFSVSFRQLRSWLTSVVTRVDSSYKNSRHRGAEWHSEPQRGSEGLEITASGKEKARRRGENEKVREIKGDRRVIKSRSRGAAFIAATDISITRTRDFLTRREK